jgi:hypothetical protein
MTLKTNSFNSGGEGNPVTISSSGNDGNAVTAVESTLTYAASAASHGAKGAKSSTSAVTAYARCSFSSMNIAAREYVRVSPASTANDIHVLAFGRGGGSFTRVASVHVNAANKLRLSDANGTSPGVWTATAALDPATIYLVEMVALVGTTTSNSTLKVSYRALGSSTPIETATITTANLGTTALTDVTFGKRSANTFLVEIDEIAWDDAATDFLGPFASPPTISITNTPGFAVVDARGSTAGDASTLTYSISPSVDVIEPVDGLFLIPQDTTDQTYTITVTQTGVAYTQNVTVDALTSGGNERPAIYTLQADGVTWA